ncbi:MAG: tRNA-dihydrouridine synthase [Myxococcota bacterium]
MREAKKPRIPYPRLGRHHDRRRWRRRFVETGCDGVLIGRGAITNPWIFRQIADGCAGRPALLPSWRDTVDALRHYLALLRETYPEKVAPARMRMMLARLLKGFTADPGLRVRCLQMPSPDDMLSHLEACAAAHGVLDTPRSEIAAEVELAA